MRARWRGDIIAARASLPSILQSLAVGFASATLSSMAVSVADTSESCLVTTGLRFHFWCWCYKKSCDLHCACCGGLDFRFSNLLRSAFDSWLWDPRFRR